MRRWKQRALVAEADAQRFKDDYLGACQQIAQMHAAAFGGEVRGPARGVVEDIEDLYARAHSDGGGA